MIYYLRGNVGCIFEGEVVMDVGGVGYYVHTNKAAITKLSLNEQATLFTSMQVKEDGITLYGFLTQDELTMFNTLLGVSGVGPKAALSLLSALTPEKLSQAIAASDETSLSKAQGIGKKTAGRIVLELKDKLKVFDGQQTLDEDTAKQDAIDALVALGYSKSDAVRAVLSVAEPEFKREQIIKLALKKLR